MRASKADVEAVYDEWAKYRTRRTILSQNRIRLIRARLKEYGAEDLRLLIRWAHESEDPQAAWLQGRNPGSRKYLDLDNLLRVGKIDARLELAWEWKDKLKSVNVSENGDSDLWSLS